MMSAGTWHGLESYRLTSGGAVLTVVPVRGGKIASLTDPDGQEWLAQPAGRVWAESPSGVSFTKAEMCGWDECSPTIDHCFTASGVELSDHGDLWDQSWAVVSTEPLVLAVNGTDYPYSFTRAVEPAEGGFDLNYRVISTHDEPEPFLWAAHPQFIADAGSWVELPEVNELIDIRDRTCVLPLMPERFRVADGSSRKLWPPRGSRQTTATLWHPDGRGLQLSWGKGLVRWAGVWIDGGAFSSQRVIAIEPATGWFDNAAEAQRRKVVTVLEPGQSLDWTLRLRFVRREVG